MPVVTITTWEDSLTDSAETQLITDVTDAVVGALGEPVRPHVTVLLNGLPRARWGSGGTQASRLPAPDEANS